MGFSCGIVSGIIKLGNWSLQLWWNLSPEFTSSLYFQALASAVGGWDPDHLAEVQKRRVVFGAANGPSEAAKNCFCFHGIPWNVKGFHLRNLGFNGDFTFANGDLMGLNQPNCGIVWMDLVWFGQQPRVGVETANVEIESIKSAGKCWCKQQKGDVSAMIRWATSTAKMVTSKMVFDRLSYARNGLKPTWDIWPPTYPSLLLFNIPPSIV